MLRLGRMFGVNIFAHWSLLLGLIMMGSSSLSLAVASHFGLPVAVLIAITSAVLLFASVVAHEFGHIFTARYYNIECDQITLSVLGGMAHLQGQFGSPSAEFWTALAGPFVSMLLGMVGLGITGLCIGTALHASILGFLMLQVALTNIALAIFNMIPAFPMDGGRILRAALWKYYNNFYYATRIAAWVGMVFGTLFVIAALMSFIGIPGLAIGGGPGLLLVGLFVFLAAKSNLNV